MGETTAISWCDSTFNPWIGCDKVSPGCRDCYAAVSRPAKVFGVKWGRGEPRHLTAESTWRKVRTWNNKAKKEGVRRRVFCASLADVFDEEVDDDWRMRLFELIHDTPHLDWLLLTKRAAAARAFLDRVGPLIKWDHIWLGVSVENQELALERIPELLQTKYAGKRFISYEPALEAVDFGMSSAVCDDGCARWRSRWVRLHRPVCSDMPFGIGDRMAAPAGLHLAHSNRHGALSIEVEEEKFLGIKPNEFEVLPYGIDWVIVGGESGDTARRFDVEWARNAVMQCRLGGAAVFVKQLGSRAWWNGCSEWNPIIDRSGSWPSFVQKEDAVGEYGGFWMLLNDDKGGDIFEWPEDLRIREFPT